jgi:hypothetical protein
MSNRDPYSDWQGNSFPQFPMESSAALGESWGVGRAQRTSIKRTSFVARRTESPSHILPALSTSLPSL